MIKLKLGKLSKFESRSDKACPYEKLYRWLILKLYPMSKQLYDKEVNYFCLPEGKTVDVTKIVVNSKTDKEFTKLTKKWAKKAYPYLTLKKLNLSVAMLHLDIAPSIDDELVSNGEVGIKDGFIRNKDD